jgi:hypothetical protein
MLVASTLGMVGITGGVAGAAGASVTCTGFTATGTTSSTAALTGCTGSTATGGSGTARSTENIHTKKGSDTITWKNTKTTKTTFTFTEGGAKAGECPSGYTVYVTEISTVVAGGNAGVPVGQKATVHLCAKTTGSAKLATSQKFTV